MKRFLKKVIGGICAISLFCSIAAIPSYATDDIHVLLDGVELSFDVPPQIIDDYTMVPMRTIFETLGYEVEWMQSDQAVFAINRDTGNCILMEIEKNYIVSFNCFEEEYPEDTDERRDFLNSHLETIDTAPKIINGRTLIPVRVVSEASGYKIAWDGINKIVKIGLTDDDIKIDISYYDATNEVNKIRNYINQGQYLEAIDLCNSTKQNYQLSNDDISVVDGLSNEAQQKYDTYLNNKLHGLITDENKKIMFEKCKRYISHSLKSPSTAIWPNYNDSNVYYNVFEEQHEIIVTFQYEAMNSFGGYVRSSAMYAFDENLNLQDITGYKLIEY